MRTDHIVIRPDRRFKRGHIVLKDGEFRGHPDDVNFKVYGLPPLTVETRKVTYIPADVFLKAPPIIITREMADAIRYHDV